MIAELQNTSNKFLINSTYSFIYLIIILVYKTIIVLLINNK